MKRFKFDKYTVLATLSALFVFCTLSVAMSAQAAGDDRQCSVTFTTGAAGTTASPSSGTCSWVAGATVLMQCDQAVYYTASGTATATDFIADFVANKDQVILYLNSSPNETQKNISVLGVSASGTCKFAKTNRRKPI